MSHPSAPFHRKRLSLLIHATLLLSPCLAQAQETNGQKDSVQELDAVTITAERRETTLQKTPLSVGVIDQGDLEKIGFDHLFDIEKSVAGVSFFKGASNQQSSILIRGIGTTNQGYTQAVGVYVDDVPLVRSVAAGQWDLPDVQRIEVLRGPQGTLYGQNSSAGAVRIVSIDPTNEKVGWVSAGIGNYSARETRGYFAGAIQEDVLAGSIAFSRREHDGFGKDHTTGDAVYGADVTQFRGKLRLLPSQGFDAVLAIDGLLDKSDNGTNATPLNYGNTAPRDTWAPQDFSRSRLERGGASLRLTKALDDNLDLRSITAFRGYKASPDAMDIGGLPRISNTWDQLVQQRTFSQEFQLLGSPSPRLSYTAGLLFIREFWKNDNWGQYGLADGVTVQRRLSKTEFNTDDFALYGQFDYKLDDRWTLTAGARYWKTEQKYDGSAYALNASLQPVSQTFAVSGLKKDSDGVTPRLTLGYQWTPDVFAYGSYTKGAKFGGYNRSSANLQVAQVAADPEEVDAYELGIKTTGFDRRLQVNATLFYNRYRDYLAIIANPILGGVTYNGSVLVNAAKAATYGSELEVRARLAQGLDWNLSYALLNTEFKDFPNLTGASGGSFTGNELPFAPKTTISTGLSYTRPFVNGDQLNLFGSAQYVSEQYGDQANSQTSKIPSRTNVDLGADYRFAGGHWTAGLRVRNLLNKDQILLITAIPGYGIRSAAYDVPRTVVASLRYDF